MARERYIIDGVEMIPLDRKKGEQEIFQNSNNFETEIINPMPEAELIKEMNRDELEADTRMSGIDMKANLHPVEITALLALDAIVGFRFLPQNCLAFSRQKKRLSRSVRFEGSKQLVDMVVGKKEQDAKNPFNMIGSAKPQQQQPAQVVK